MNIYQVRFIKSKDDDESKHLVIEITAETSDAALTMARTNAKDSGIQLFEYGHNSVEVKHFT